MTAVDEEWLASIEPGYLPQATGPAAEEFKGRIRLGVESFSGFAVPTGELRP